MPFRTGRGRAFQGSAAQFDGIGPPRFEYSARTMRRLLRYAGRILLTNGHRLQEWGTRRYYYDPQAARDPVLVDLCQRIQAGTPWRDAIRDPRARHHGERLAEYGYMTDVIRRLRPASLLDVGCVLNLRAFDPFIPPSCAVSFLNPASEPIARERATYFKAPLEEFHGPRFPLVTCLSTLEHVGFDNTRYGTHLKDLGWDWPEAIQGIVRSVERLVDFVADEGELVVSCPFGRKEFVRLPPETGVRVWQVLHAEHLAALRASPRLRGLEFILLRLGSQGWEAAEETAEFPSFGAVGPGASGLVLMHLRRQA